MGFPSFFVVPTPVIDLKGFLGRIRLVVLWIMWCLGLFDPSNPETIWDGRTYRLQASSDPSATPATADLIKKRLPVLEFGQLVNGFRSLGEEHICAVCLGCLERRELVRELRNCCHVFHKGCLDKWVDQSQVTCPLCRSGLLPERSARYGCEVWSWVVKRISYFFGEHFVRGGAITS